MQAPSVAAKAVFFVALSIATMMLDHERRHLDAVRAALAVAVYPLRAAVDAPFAVAHWLGTTLASREALIEENQALLAERMHLRVRLQRMAALEAENVRLRALMQSARMLEHRVLVAEILQVDLDPFRHRVVIDKGARDGVHLGQPVLDAGGIMGQVTAVDSLGAEVILITDPSHAIPVEVVRNSVRTIAIGTGELDRLELPYLPNSADIEPGDMLVSSGLGGRFPRGYPVGTVVTVAREPTRAFAHITARPAAALDRSREVLLAWTTEEAAAPADAGSVSP